jgi:hypothetical protein
MGRRAERSWPSGSGPQGGHDVSRALDGETGPDTLRPNPDRHSPAAQAAATFSAWRCSFSSGGSGCIDGLGRLPIAALVLAHDRHRPGGEGDAEPLGPVGVPDQDLLDAGAGTGPNRPG